jgi:hypothetical protein
MKRVLITSVFEDACTRLHHIGYVTESEYYQLRALVGSTVHERQEGVDKYPVLRKVYHYTTEGGVHYEDCMESTDAFTKITADDAASEPCYHIIWEACG